VLTPNLFSDVFFCRHGNFQPPPSSWCFPGRNPPPFYSRKWPFFSLLPPPLTPFTRLGPVRMCPLLLLVLSRFGKEHVPALLLISLLPEHGKTSSFWPFTMNAFDSFFFLVLRPPFSADASYFSHTLFRLLCGPPTVFSAGALD